MLIAPRGAGTVGACYPLACTLHVAVLDVLGILLSAVGTLRYSRDVASQVGCKVRRNRLNWGCKERATAALALP